MSGIDFVVLWVDGGDVNWLAEKKKYDENMDDPSSCAARYRDWNNLQYWFRGVEKFAPWVDRIFFITWGHTPSWLNLQHPKIRVIKHEDFIPKEYLPTFNSNTIELNLHRIPELSEKFVLFNDDMFIIRDVKEKDFFAKNKLHDEFVMNAIVPYEGTPIISHTCLNNVMLINKHFNKKKITRKMFWKVYNPIYGFGFLRNISLIPWGSFPGFFNAHIPLAHFKSTFCEVWDKEWQMLNDTCVNKFRRYNDLNHWVMRYWNLCSGKFTPRRGGFGKIFTAGKTNEKMIDCIVHQKKKTVCINDYVLDFDFSTVSAQVRTALETILPDKSSFEK